MPKPEKGSGFIVLTGPHRIFPTAAKAEAAAAKSCHETGTHHVVVPVTILTPPESKAAPQTPEGGGE